MTDTMNLKETSNRQLRLKLTSLGRRIDELEEATKNLHRTEDELMDLQDKVIQAEGSNSSLLTEVDILRKRVLTIEGKDEEVRKAEDMCRNLKEKLETEVKLSIDLKVEIEKLQDRMAELEKLEEAFNKSKSDCTQLCLSLNEEKNLTRKLTTELEVLRSRVKELESSESRLDKAEKNIIEELEKLKSLTVILAEERKTMNEKLKQNEQVIQDLTKKLEQNNKINVSDQSRNSSNFRTNVNEKTYNYTGDRGDLRIEEDMSIGLSSKVSLAKKGLDSLKITHNVGLRNKEAQEGQEDNKIKDLTQEIERLKKRLKLLEKVEEDLKKTEAKHNELQEKFLSEQNKSKLLADQIEEMKLQMSRNKALENGETAHQEIRIKSRHDKPKYKGVAAEPQVLKEKIHEVSSQPRSQREKVINRDLLLEDDNIGKSYRRPLSPSASRRFQRTSSNPRMTATNEKKSEDKSSVHSYSSGQKDQDLHPEKLKKPREQPSVLSRYPPAANEPNVKRPWTTQSKQSENGPKNKPEKASRDYSDLEQSSALSERQKKTLSYLHNSENENITVQDEVNDSGEDSSSTSTPATLLNGTVPSYRNHTSSPTSHGEPKNAFLVEVEVPLATDNESPMVKSAEKLPSFDEPETIMAVTSMTRPRRSRYLHSTRSQDISLEYTAVKCYTDEEPIKYKHTEAIASEDVTVSQKPGPELKRVCSPREGLRSKAIIKPAIIAIDKKEVMTAGTEPSAGEQRLSPKTVPNKVTSSITILPSDLPSQRVNSSVMPKEKHTSTSNITIGSSETSLQRSNISVPYEISIRRSDITMKPSESDSCDEDETESESEVSVSSSITIKSSEFADDNSSVTSYELRRRNRTTNQAETETKSPVNVLERASWRNSRTVAQSESTRYESDAGTDFSRITVRRTNRTTASNEAAEQNSSAKGNLSEGYTKRLNNFSNSLDTVEPKSSLTSETAPHRSYFSSAETIIRRKQNATVASKVADWNNTYSLTGQDSSDLHSALNSSLMSKKKELAKQILSDIATERVPRSETVGKRQSVKLELRRNPGGSPTHQTGTRTEDKTPVGILSQIRMTSRR
ncbi:leucine zipper protein 1 [Heptranchias perlo]|uniref:leucine zipper protein 1 n=1 Tax=Heptranchias perlo TaxID=212740 RepID=UPI00355A0D76